MMAYLTLDLVDGLSETTDVLAGDTGHGYAAILGCIHRVLFNGQYANITDFMEGERPTSLARESICSGFNPV
jgi:hypothetical protein